MRSLVVLIVYVLITIGCGKDDPIAPIPIPPPPPDFSGEFLVISAVSENTCGIEPGNANGIYRITISGGAFVVNARGEQWTGSWDATNTQGAGETTHFFNVIGACLIETWFTLNFNYLSPDKFSGIVIFWGRRSLCEESLCSISWNVSGDRFSK